MPVTSARRGSFMAGHGTSAPEGRPEHPICATLCSPSGRSPRLLRGSSLPMVGLFLTSWVVAPVAMLLVVAGLGLLVRRLSGGALAPLHVLPVGFAALLVVGAL